MDRQQANQPATFLEPVQLDIATVVKCEQFLLTSYVGRLKSFIMATGML